MYRTILVPLDGSPFAEHALPVALAVARRCGAAIHLVDVTSPLSGAALESGVSLNVGELEKSLSDRSQAYLDGTLARLRARIDVPITGEVPFGDVVPKLSELADSGRYDLVVMATHGRSPFGRFWLGSVADEMMHRTSLPLLLVRPGTHLPNLDEEPDLSRVVVPLDGSNLAEQILEPAMSLAALMPGAEIVLLRSIPASVSDELADVSDTSTWLDAELYLDSIADRVKARGLRVECLVVFYDQPVDAIVHTAEGEQAGLIALETHGRAGLDRLLHGSVTDKVIRGARMPVLVHRPVKTV
jgi:nucleotide-binding universal stress UspA family protein